MNEQEKRERWNKATRDRRWNMTVHCIETASRNLLRNKWYTHDDKEAWEAIRTAYIDIIELGGSVTYRIEEMRICDYDALTPEIERSADWVAGEDWPEGDA